MLWSGAVDKSGYGICHFNGKSKRAHRIVMLLSGKDISGRKILHCCGNPSCCNPDHLVIEEGGSHQPSIRRKEFRPLYARGRARISATRLMEARGKEGAR